MTPRNTARAALALLAAALWLASPAAARAQRAHAADGPVMWSDVEVEFEGTRAFTAEQLKKVARERVAGWFVRPDGAAGDLSARPFDPARLDYLLRMDVVGFMRRSGYLRARIGEVRQERVGRALLVTAPVEEGELYRLGEVSIEGAEYFTADKLREYLPLRRGDVADGVAVVRWLGSHLKALYADSGFIQYEYEVVPEFKLDPGLTAGVADLRVTVSEGRRFVIRRIAFSGSRAAPEEVLRARLLVREGEVFSARKFRDSVDEINRLPYFEHIDAERDTEFRTDDETGDLELIVRLTERAARPQ